MAIRIQLRRDTSANWIANNPILLPGELGIEMDTFKFKIGTGARWNSIQSYAFKVGEANGVAGLGPTGKLISSQLPDSFSVTADIQQAIEELSTTNISEGTNLYYTNQRAIDANISQIQSAIDLEVSARSSEISDAKNEAVSIAAIDATNKSISAKNEAILSAGLAADIKVAAAKEEAIVNSNSYTDDSIVEESSIRDEAIGQAILIEVDNRNSAINSSISAAVSSLTTSTITEGTNKYFTDARVSDSVTSILSTKTTDNILEGTTNKYFTNQRALAATIPAIEQSALDVITSVNGYADDQLSLYVRTDDRDANYGFPGIDSGGKILESVIPTSIARVTDIVEAVANVVGSAPESLNTLQELASALQEDESAAASLASLVGTKSNTASPTFTGTVTIPTLQVTTANGITKSMVGLSNVDDTSDLSKPISTSTQTALNLKAPLNSPLFTGAIDFSNATVSGLTESAAFPFQPGNSGKFLTTDGSSPYWSDITLSDYLTLIDAQNNYLSINDAQNNYLSINDAQSGYIQVESLSNALSEYILEADRNQSGGFAGLNVAGYISSTVIDTASISNYKLENYSISINGTQVDLGGTFTTSTYSNSNNPSAVNQIGYGTSETPNISSAVAGDIYIQY